MREVRFKSQVHSQIWFLNEQVNVNRFLTQLAHWYPLPAETKSAQCLQGFLQSQCYYGHGEKLKMEGL